MTVILDASEVARRFRVWRMTHRPVATIAQLEKETLVPAKHLQSVLTTKTVATEYKQHLQMFLAAFEQGNTEALAEMHAVQSPDLPAAHAPHQYAPHITEALRSRRVRKVGTLGRQYCLIARQDISARQCLMTQKCPDCYGCAAATRFCAECGFDVLAFAGAELCSYCLSHALADPATDKPKQLWLTGVPCQQANGRVISIDTCGRMQGDACTGCSVASRICLQCKAKRVRYPDFGLCLGCHTNMLGFGWEPLSDGQMQQIQAERDQIIAGAVAADAARERQETADAEAAAEEAAVEAETRAKAENEARELQQRILSAPPAQALPVESWKNATGLPLIGALAAMWAAVQAQHTDLPSAMILPAPASSAMSRMKKTEAHFAPFRWKQKKGRIHEISVVAEMLNRPASEILGSLLHEAAHALNFVRDIYDCSASDYHNKHFKVAAEQLGLSVTQVDHYGFSETRPTRETLQLYAAETQRLAKVLMHRCEPSEQEDIAEDADVAMKGGRYKKAVCGCGHNIRVARRTMAATTILCGVCEEPFVFQS